MIKTLVVNGCSWTAGNELEHDPAFEALIHSVGLRKHNPQDYNDWNLVDNTGEIVSSFDKFYDQLNWAGRLREKLAIPDLVNLSTGGGSNTRILRTTIDHVTTLPEDKRSETLIVVGWTISERDELYVADSWQRWNATQTFSSTVDRLTLNNDKLIKKLDKFQEDYIALVHNDYAAVYRYFQQSYLLANLLDNLGIHYFFFNALPAWFSAGPLASNIDIVEKFNQQIQWQETHRKMLSNNDTMFEFVNLGSYPVAPYKHPLSQGHLAWANYIYETLLKRQLI